MWLAVFSIITAGAMASLWFVRPSPACRSVAFTYNDPVIFAEYAMDVADACHARGVKTVAVTAGYMHDAPRRDFYAKMDAAKMPAKPPCCNRLRRFMFGSLIIKVNYPCHAPKPPTSTWIRVAPPQRINPTERGNVREMSGKKMIKAKPKNKAPI